MVGGINLSPPNHKSGRYTSSWNAFLLFIDLLFPKIIYIVDTGVELYIENVLKASAYEPASVNTGNPR